VEKCGFSDQKAITVVPVGRHVKWLVVALMVVCSFGTTMNAQTETNMSLQMSASEFASNNARLFNEFTNESQIDKSYRAGLISKGEAMQASMLIQNRKSADIYGKVIDQYGQPISGVDVTGSVAIRQGWYAEDKWEHYKTNSDANGLFQFTGLNGADWAVDVAKDGYEMDYRVGWSGPRGGPHGTLSSPSNRAVLTLWKIRGAEPLIHKEFQSRVPYDGTSAGFNLATWKRAASGDLELTLSRFPLKIHRGRDKYDWTLKIAMPQGGLLAEADPYPYWAPEGGYMKVFESGMKSNSVPWSGELRQDFYLRTPEGRYGRLFLDLSTDSMRPDTGVSIEIWVNPSGSRNLEFDPKKQIRP
jgi:hypothetical protein